MKLWNVIPLVVLIVALTPKANAIKCYQCSSSIDVHCTENIDVQDTNLELRDCSDIHDAKYCVKTTGVFKGEVGTTRFCSSENLGHICDFQQRMGDVRSYRGCIYTCYHDGCNSAEKIGKHSLILIITFLIILTFKVYR